MTLSRLQVHRISIRIAVVLLAFFTVSGRSITFAQSPGDVAPTEYDSSTQTSLRAAGRILNQTTFGPTVNTVLHVEKVGVSSLVDEQLNTSPYLMPNTIPAADYTNGDCNGWNCDPESWWWHNAIFGQDQLRQRVAYALNKLFVVSYIGLDGRYMPYYLNVLSNDAFGNWFDLMQDVSLSGAMGTYLNAANSQAAAPGSHADENFARELMQLFSIGTVRLNENGTIQPDSDGNPVPNYTQEQVQNLARAFTGYTFANDDCSQPSQPLYYWWPDPPGAGCAMVPLDQFHDTGPKVVLRGETLPAGQGAAADFTAALDNIFRDPSLPPFVSRRLIQNLVKSNPSTGYIYRVASVFTDDGNGVRGDMKAVIRAILLDPEARADDGINANASPDTGLMRDPVLWWISMLRALEAKQNTSAPWTGEYHNIFDLWLRDLGEEPRFSPSVFSFYTPNFKINGGALYAPEFQIENTHSISQMIQHAQELIDNNLYLAHANEFTLDLSENSWFGHIAATKGADGIVNLLSALLMQGTMTNEMHNSIVTAITGLDPATMLRNAVHLIVTSPQYRIMI